MSPAFLFFFPETGEKGSGMKKGWIVLVLKFFKQFSLVTLNVFVQGLSIYNLSDGLHV